MLLQQRAPAVRRSRPCDTMLPGGTGYTSVSAGLVRRRLLRFDLEVTVHGVGGDWSIFRPVGATCKFDVVRKHGPVPLFPRPRKQNGDKSPHSKIPRGASANGAK